MAQVIEYDWNQKVHRGSNYPWDEWFNGDTWELKVGVDFDSDFKNFRHLAYSQARYHGFKIRTRSLKKDEVLLLQRTEIVSNEHTSTGTDN